MSELESLLLARRAELVQRAASLRAELDALRDARSDSTADDEHDPEGSTLSDDWSRIAGLMDASAAENREVDAALLRLLDGSYGRCVSCGRDIPGERLRARPAATRCVACASA